MTRRSSLFQLAGRQQRERARQAWLRTPSMRFARDVRKILGGGARRERALETMYKRLATPEARRLIRTMEIGSVSRYNQLGEGSEFQRLMKMIGPLGALIQTAIDTGPQHTGIDPWDAAVNWIRAMGGEVLVGKGRAGHERGVEAARKFLEDAGYEVRAPEEPRGGGPSDVQAQPTWGREDAHDWDADWIVETEQRVQSSNVWGYSYIQETQRLGTLYVTFLAWHPGTKKSNAPGATYAYYDVSPQKYRAFARAAQRSAGEAVWDYLRVRGSEHEHQVPYELVGGVMVQGAGVYLPRKVTPRGYMRRTVRGRDNKVYRSWLPSREFAPNRGEPNRGEPNRG